MENWWFGLNDLGRNEKKVCWSALVVCLMLKPSEIQRKSMWHLHLVHSRVITLSVTTLPTLHTPPLF